MSDFKLFTYFLKHLIRYISFLAVVRVALDIRLGSLDKNLPENSEARTIINSINTFFWNVAEVELRLPIWRVYKNKAFRKYINALETFRT